MKYDSLLGPVQASLPSAQNILIALPAQPSVDHLSAGLALFLALEQAGKNVSIVTEGVIRVGQANLFGVGQIQNKLLAPTNGDFVITISGVATPDGQVPAVEKMDYYTSDSNLNLVFRIKPGQKFTPTNINPHYQDNGFNLIFTIGTHALTDLGSLYTNNQEAFQKSQVVNIDNSQTNSNFSSVNVVDPAASSISEMMLQILPSFNLSFDGDIASNILAGIFTATNNLQAENVNADTYEAVATALRFGGKKPIETMGQNLPPDQKPIFPLPQSSQPITSDIPASQPAAATQPFGQPASTPTQGFNLNQVFRLEMPPASPQSTDQTQTTAAKEPEPQPSPEETPVGEEAITPEDDWLTPKIYKGSSIG